MSVIKLSSCSLLMTLLAKQLIAADYLVSLFFVEEKIARLFDDVDRYIYQPVTNSKDYRQVLDRPEAKALTVMQQKWPKLCKQEMHLELRALIPRVCRILQLISVLDRLDQIPLRLKA
jgi:hypothetical protein